MQNGKRYENMSWRLMNRETFCCSHEQKQRSTVPRPEFAAARTMTADKNVSMPALSSSTDTNTDIDDISRSENALQERPAYRRLDSADSSRSRTREKHMAPVNLEKIVTTIQETSLEPIELPIAPSVTRVSETIPSYSTPIPMTKKSDSDLSHETHASPTKECSASQANPLESSTSTVATKSSLTDSRNLPQLVGSQGSSNTEMSTHSIIRGFVPGGAPSSYRSQTNLHAQPTPILKSANHHPPQPKKKGPMFTIGTSSGEDESSLESHMYKNSISECLRRNPGHLGGKKQTSFKDEIAVGRAAEHSPVFDSDDEDEEVSESAIEDDDDSSDWEDSDDQSGPSSINDKELFQRVDSRPNLASRRSLLTSALHEPDRARALADAATRSTPALRRSRTSTPNGPSLATTPNPSIPIAWSGHNATAARPIAMASSTTQLQLALSPRTTRRNMLSTELTESLRKNLLWERQHRSTGNLAALKRRHTSNDVKNLRQHPEPGPVLSHRDTSQFNNDFFNAGLGEYHTKGW